MKLRETAERMVTVEHAFLIGALVFSGYTFVESYNFGWEAAIFPRFTSIVTLIGCVLLLIRNWLPRPLDLLLVDNEEELIGGGGVMDGDRDEALDEEDHDVDRPLDPVPFMSLLLVGFAIVGSAVGLLWTIPVFIVFFGVWFDLSKRAIALLTIVGFLIGYGFQMIFNIPMGNGFLLTTLAVIATTGGADG